MTQQSQPTVKNIGTQQADYQHWSGIKTRDQAARIVRWSLYAGADGRPVFDGPEFEQLVGWWMVPSNQCHQLLRMRCANPLVDDPTDAEWSIMLPM